MDERAEGPAGAPPTWEDFVRANGRTGGDGPRAIPDLSPLIAIVEALRRAVPHELQEQFNALQRELLLTLRARYVSPLTSNSRSAVSPTNWSPSSRKTLSSKRMTSTGATIFPDSTQNEAKRVMPVNRHAGRSEKLRYQRLPR